MTLIDADVFLEYLIFSKHIDGLTCGEVKEAIEMSKVDVFDKIKAEIEQVANEEQKHDEKWAKGLRYAAKIIDKYMIESEDKMREIEPYNIIQDKDLYIRINKILSSKECNVPNCKCTDCYEIQYEQPEGLSFIGGFFCEQHLKRIFNIAPYMKSTN